MRKRYGITNNPEKREKELRKSHDGVKNFKVVKQFPDQKTAQNWEKYKRDWRKKEKGAKYFHGYCSPYRKKTKSSIYGYCPFCKKTLESIPPLPDEEH